MWWSTIRELFENGTIYENFQMWWSREKENYISGKKCNVFSPMTNKPRTFFEPLSFFGSSGFCSSSSVSLSSSSSPSLSSSLPWKCAPRKQTNVTQRNLWARQLPSCSWFCPWRQRVKKNSCRPSTLQPTNPLLILYIQMLKMVFHCCSHFVVLPSASTHLHTEIIGDFKNNVFFRLCFQV